LKNWKKCKGKVFEEGKSKPKLIELITHTTTTTTTTTTTAISTQNTSQHQQLDFSPQYLFKKSDLRIDEAYLNMARVFNSIWESNRVGYEWQSDFYPVRHVIYEVFPCGTECGLIEFLPHCRGVLELWGHSHRRADWKFTPQLLVTSVGYFVTAFVLRLGDMHQDNLLLSKTYNELIGIDFAFIGESTEVTTGEFPIPVGLLKLFADQLIWGKFIELCWEAIQILKIHKEDILGAGKEYSVDPKMYQMLKGPSMEKLNTSYEDLKWYINHGPTLTIAKTTGRLVQAWWGKSQ